MTIERDVAGQKRGPLGQFVMRTMELWQKAAADPAMQHVPFGRAIEILERTYTVKEMTQQCACDDSGPCKMHGAAAASPQAPAPQGEQCARIACMFFCRDYEPALAKYFDDALADVKSPGASPGLERIAQEIAKEVAERFPVEPGDFDVNVLVADKPRLYLETIAEIVSRSLEGRGGELDALRRERDEANTISGNALDEIRRLTAAVVENDKSAGAWMVRAETAEARTAQLDTELKESQARSGRILQSLQEAVDRAAQLEAALREIRKQICSIPLSQITAMEEHVRSLAEAALGPVAQEPKAK